MNDKRDAPQVVLQNSMVRVVAVVVPSPMQARQYRYIVETRIYDSFGVGGWKKQEEFGPGSVGPRKKTYWSIFRNIHVNKRS